MRHSEIIFYAFNYVYERQGFECPFRMQEYLMPGESTWMVPTWENFERWS